MQENIVKEEVQDVINQEVATVTVPEEHTQVPKKKGKGGIVVIVILAIILLIGVGYFFMKDSKKDNEDKPTTTTSTTTKPAETLKEDKYFNIGAKTKYYEEYKFDFSSLDGVAEYNIHNFKFHVSLENDGGEVFEVNDKQYDIGYLGDLSLYYIIPMNAIFIVWTGDSDVPTFVDSNNNSIDIYEEMAKKYYTEFLEFSINDDKIEIKSLRFGDYSVNYNGEHYNYCKEEEKSKIEEDYPTVVKYTYSLDNKTFNIDDMNSSTEQTFKEHFAIYGDDCSDLQGEE